ALLRQGPRGLHPEREDRRSEQAAASGGGLREEAPGSGADDGADRGSVDGGPPPPGRGRGERGRPPVHDDAGRGEAELEDDHQCHEGSVPGGSTHARGVSAALDDQRGAGLSAPSLAGRTVLVTGASRGIGRATAEALAAAGAWVAMVARSEADLRRAAEAFGGHALVADVTSSTSVARLAEQVGERIGGAPDILVNA